jgi:hypothetical protein
MALASYLDDIITVLNMVVRLHLASKWSDKCLFVAYSC